MNHYHITLQHTTYNPITLYNPITHNTLFNSRTQVQVQNTLLSPNGAICAADSIQITHKKTIYKQYKPLPYNSRTHNL